MTEEHQNDTGFWPGGAQLAISISMQFEAGAQGKDADGPFPPMEAGLVDTITPTWYEYGMNEGIPRLLDLWDRHDVKVTSHMVGQAVERRPDLAKELVSRGHEAAAHGYNWTPQFGMDPREERLSYEKNIEVVERVTGHRPVGFNAFWMRQTRATFEILQELGFLYHTDDLSRDEPALTLVNNKPLIVVPYTLRCNDIGRFSSQGMTSAAFEQELKDEFDVLYAEGARRRRMMSISTHDRIGGAPGIVGALDRFLTYAKQHEGVVFMRKDEIAQYTLQQDDVPINPPRKF
ncbi:polysaccharide deacetylase family protein (plasmid) [Leisingera sp. S132]|uniref:polysaccharide deacetylase family protein n=1 Tax=Leisingera sp. S132 TaxID=2867016 RepID=UPI00147DA6C7|nr:polysaccharide deacetylase family protein [Leisingera sp. S132]UWQ81471.1 polysaccharide deacetylase family protein [Leisingera sp. S132]